MVLGVCLRTLGHAEEACQPTSLVLAVLLENDGMAGREERLPFEYVPPWRGRYVCPFVLRRA
jgi:hypothetical protein